MRLWPFRRKAATASAGIIDSIQRGEFNAIRALGGTNARVRAAINSVIAGGYGYQYRTSPAVRMVVDLIARNMGQLSVDLYRYRGQAERQLEENHPAADSIHRPNPTMTMDQLLRALVTDFCVYGNAFAQKGGSGQGPITIWPIPAQLVEVYGDGLVAEFYVIHRVDGSYTDPIPAEQFIHWKTSNPEDPRIGLSPLATLRDVLAEDAANQAAILELAKTGLGGPVWVYSPADAPDISNEARHRAEEDLHNRLQRMNAYPPFMEEGRELRPFGVSPKEAETLATRRYAIEQVAGLYGVPLAMLGLATFDAEAQAEFYTDTLQPLCGQLACELDLSILQQVYGETDLSYAFDVDEKFIGDERIKTMISGAGAPILLRDEARARLGLGPLPDDIGKRPVIPSNIMEEDGTSTGKPSVDVMPPQNPAGPDQSGAGRQGDPYTQSVNGGGKAHLVPRRQRADERRDNWARVIQDQIQGFLTDQQKKGKIGIKTEKQNRSLADALVPVFQRQVKAEGDLQAERMASKFDPAFTQHYLVAKAKGFAGEFNTQTANDISAMGAADAFDRARNMRAPGAAMKLATDCAGFAVKTAVEQTRDRAFRTVTIDGGDCPICAPYQGVWSAADVPGWPGYHNNCNCVADPS